MKTDAKNRRRFTLYQQVEEIEVMIVMFEKELKNDRSGIKLDEE
jgi:hypothetical protein|tara:strand:+ start:241 stop:372 length:132 start_codon:yes stop_codon:yes gene_type:complete